MESSYLSVSIFLSQYHPGTSAFSIKMIATRWEHFMYWCYKSGGWQSTEAWRDEMVASFELALRYDSNSAYTISTVDYRWVCCLNQDNVLAFSF